MRPLGREFFDRPAQEVAPTLLGCVLEHETHEGLVAVTLTEVEAYAGETDPASHAWRGKTQRNAVMYGPPGHAYVYFTYGMHFCVNVVCMPEGTACAVLLRAGRVITGEELARRRRSARRSALGDLALGDLALGDLAERDGHASPARAPVFPATELARGPARLCQALAIDRVQNGWDLCAPGSPLRLGRAGSDARQGTGLSISAGPRVGVSVGADTRWRFWLTGDPTVSTYRPHKPRTARQAARRRLAVEGECGSA